MALIIRLRQQGKTNRHSFRLVVVDRRCPRDGKYHEMLGWYDPFAKEENLVAIKADRVQYWLEQGALISDRAKALVNRMAPEVIQKWTQKRMLTKAKKKKKVGK